MRADDQGQYGLASRTSTKGMMCFTFRPKESAREKFYTPCRGGWGRLSARQQITRILLREQSSYEESPIFRDWASWGFFLQTDESKNSVGNHKAHFARTESRPLSEPSIFNNYGARSLRNKQSNTFPHLSDYKDTQND